MSVNDPGYKLLGQYPSFTCAVINSDTRVPASYNLTATATPPAAALISLQQTALGNLYSRWALLSGWPCISLPISRINAMHCAGLSAAGAFCMLLRLSAGGSLPTLELLRRNDVDDNGTDARC